MECAYCKKNYDDEFLYCPYCGKKKEKRVRAMPALYKCLPYYRDEMLMNIVKTFEGLDAKELKKLLISKSPEFKLFEVTHENHKKVMSPYIVKESFFTLTMIPKIMETCFYNLEDAENVANEKNALLKEKREQERAEKPYNFRAQRESDLWFDKYSSDGYLGIKNFSFWKFIFDRKLTEEQTIEALQLSNTGLDVRTLANVEVEEPTRQYLMQMIQEHVCRDNIRVEN